MKITIAAIVLSLCATNLHPQVLWWGREVNPSDYTIEKPTLPNSSTAEMFVKACLRGGSSFYSASDFTFPYRTLNPELLQAIAPEETPFQSISESQFWELEGEHIFAFSLRPAFGEYLIYLRAFKNNQHHEICSIATTTLTQIELLLDVQEAIPKLGFELGEIQEYQGVLRFSATYREMFRYKIKLGETNGAAWLLIEQNML